MIEPWKTMSHQPIADCRVFQVRKDMVQSPHTGDLHDFYIIEAGRWVNIIPVTPEGQVVLVQQHRYGIGEATLEVPGGMIDAEDANPAVAARREMLEETGYDSDEIIYLGTVHPNPAIMDNQCDSFLALNATKVGAQNLDEREEITVALAPLADIPAMVLSGEITHALNIAAFYFARQYWDGLKNKLTTNG